MLTGLMEQTVEEVADKVTAYRARLVALGSDPEQRDRHADGSHVHRR